MGNVPAAKLSPRLEYGILKWYEDDTFSLLLLPHVVDLGGHEVTLTQDDTAVIRFYDWMGGLVTTMDFADLSSQCMRLDFPEAVTALFPRGRYHYDVILTHDQVTTVARGNRILVE